MKVINGLLLGLLATGMIPLAHATDLTVAATTDIWLAGQPDGSSVTGFFGTDVAPGNSPVSVAVSGGNVFTFSASGTTSVDGSCFAGPDGGCYTDQYSFSDNTSLPNGISSYAGPASALIGVFVGPGTPSGTGTDNGDNPPDPTLTSHSPALNQVFFIGDGLTGTGTGSVQTFMAPGGAVVLYLAVADSVGGSTGNSGALSVTVTAVPEPEDAAMMFVGLGLVGLRLRSRKNGKISIHA